MTKLTKRSVWVCAISLLGWGLCRVAGPGNDLGDLAFLQHWPHYCTRRIGDEGHGGDGRFGTSTVFVFRQGRSVHAKTIGTRGDQFALDFIRDIRSHVSSVQVREVPEISGLAGPKYVVKDPFGGPDRIVCTSVLPVAEIWVKDEPFYIRAYRRMGLWLGF